MKTAMFSIVNKLESFNAAARKAVISEVNNYILYDVYQWQ